MLIKTKNTVVETSTVEIETPSFFKEKNTSHPRFAMVCANGDIIQINSLGVHKYENEGTLHDDKAADLVKLYEPCEEKDFAFAYGQQIGWIEKSMNKVLAL